MRINMNMFIALICIVVFSFNTTVNAYAINSQSNEKFRAANIIFLTDGQGNESMGAGTESNPYLNIKTAIDNVEEGGTIKIIGQFRYWEYEETSQLLHRPLIIDKKVTFEGENPGTKFILRAPIQLGADVTFKNLTMEFWASNELMPGVPDPGYPQTPIDEGTVFRSGRTIYLAGNKLTLDNINTRINTGSFQRDYRPYISGGRFLGEGKLGPKAVLNVINPNEGTEFAGIYAGDYWNEESFPVELNLNGRVLDKTIHTGGIINKFNGEVVVNIYDKGRISKINTYNHNANVDVNLKENVNIRDAEFNGIRDLTLERNTHLTLGSSQEFSINNLTIKRDSLLDFRGVSGNVSIKGDFIGDVDSNSTGGAIFLHNNQMLDIKGDVKGSTKLNSYNNINKVPLKENHTYIKAKENATGDFFIEPEYSQSKYRLIKNTNDLKRTSWITYRDKEIFKDFRWNGNENDKIIIPEKDKDYIYPIEFINEKNETYIPFGEDWDEFSLSLKKPDGTILDDNNSWDGDLEIYLDESGPIINIYNESFLGELLLTITHESGKSINKKIQVGKIITSNGPVINGADNITIKVGQVEGFNLLGGITVTDDRDKNLIPTVSGKLGKPSPGTNKKYTIIYEVTDSDNNTTTVTRVITVTNQLPIIEGLNDITINKGESADLKQGVTAKDNEDGILTGKIVFPSINLSTLREGKHQVIYKVTDSDGNSISEKRIINVNKNNSSVDKPFTSLRLGGSDRYNTAIEIAKKFQNGKMLDNVVIANGSNFPDALTGSALATSLNAPILLTYTNYAPKTRTIEYIKSNLKKEGTVYLLGSAGVVPDGYINELKAAGFSKFVRLGGSDRYATNLEIVNRMNVKEGTPIFVANSTSFADSLSASPISAAKGMPIFLSFKDYMPEKTMNAIKKIKPSKIYVVGSNGVITDGLANQLSKIATVIRLGGADRYDTCLAINKHFNLDTDNAIIASGLDFPDALTGSVLAAKLNAPIILLPSWVGERQKTYIDSTKMRNLYVLGGNGLITDSMINELKK